MAVSEWDCLHSVDMDCLDEVIDSLRFCVRRWRSKTHRVGRLDTSVYSEFWLVSLNA